MTLNPNTQQHHNICHLAKDRHGANFYSSYVEIHETVMNQFRERHFISGDTLEFIPITPNLYLNGYIFCQGQIAILVEKKMQSKFLDDCDDPLIQTASYAYNVFLPGIGNIFRYDNQDKDYLRPGHRDDHHKHTFSFVKSDSGKIIQTIENIDSPVWIGKENWPTLGDVIKETESWYWDNYDSLPFPDLYSSLECVRSLPSLEL